MNEVLTPDGWGQVLRSETVRGRTSYLVKGARFEGWYDALQVTADWAEQPDEVVPNEDNNTVLPYPSDPRGPGWGGDTTNTISLKPDFHLPVEDHASDSLTGNDTDEDPVEAPIEGLFEPHSRLSSAPRHRLHFAGSDDPILEVSRLPEESPSDTGADTEDLFDDSRPHFERGASYDRLVIEDDLSFMKYAAEDENSDEKSDSDDDSDDDDDDKKKDKDDDSDDDNDDSESDSDDDGDGRIWDDDDDSGPDSDKGRFDSEGKTGSFALSTTADLHFLANLCTCAAALPLHSKAEHRELEVEAKKRKKPLGSQPLKGKFGDQNPHTPEEAGYREGAKGVAKTIQKNPEPRQDHGQWGNKRRKVDRPIQYAAADFSPPPAHTPANGVKPQERDLDALHERYLEQPQPFHQDTLDLVDHEWDDADAAGNYNKAASVEKRADGYDKYIGGSDGHYYLIASGDGKLPKGEHYGHYDSYEDAHAAVEAIIARNHSRHGSTRTAAPAQPQGPTQIESQIEQLMQFWAVDNNGWWHWTGSQADLALLNQMQQQVAMVGMPQGQPGAMQAQSAFSPEANTPAPWREYLQVIASDRLVALAAWKDVVEKSKRLRAEGAVKVETFRPNVITAYVQGDNGRYYTTVQRLGSVQGMGKQNLTSAQVSGWSCDCEWGHWAFLRKRSFVGRMCSHAYAVFSEMRSLDAKARKDKGKPKTAGVGNKSSWSRNGQGFEWVSDDPMAPTGAITLTASGYTAQVWSDGTTEDSLNIGTFPHSEQARRAISRVILAHLKLAAPGDINLVDDGTMNPYDQDGDPQSDNPDQGGSNGVEEDNSRIARSVFAEEHRDKEDDGIEEEDPDDDDESLDEEVADDEDDSDDGSDDDGGEDPDAGDEPDDDDGQGDGGHYEKHRRDEHDDDEHSDDGTDNPGDESDDDGIAKKSVAQLQQQYGLTHLAGADYSLQRQNALVNEGNGKTARNIGDLDLTGTHYVGISANSKTEAEDVLAFLF